MDPLSPQLVIVLISIFMFTLAAIMWRFFLAPASQSNPAVPKFSRWAHSLRFEQVSIRWQSQRRIWFWLGITLFMAALAVGLVVKMSEHISLDPLIGQQLTHQEQVRSQLNPERLVPPPPLPPSFFSAPERPDLTTADRDWYRMDPGFAQIVLQLFHRMKQCGYDPVLLEGYRSPERQNHLAAIGPHVTHAKAFQSRHQFGLAADIAFSRDGRLVISEKDPWAAEGYRRLGEHAEALGLTWGGRWTLRDLGHVELNPRTRPQA